MHNSASGCGGGTGGAGLACCTMLSALDIGRKRSEFGDGVRKWPTSPHPNTHACTHACHKHARARIQSVELRQGG